ncbi:Ig-like domain-containing protein [Mycolicibacterium arseniciresistens]|uniref:Ig-like domain-containing protein n=1 Tax=Mycolicibacterium arseniciresistens TaxID=3062257 RepID=A0ABT8UEB5_9MYCO|nr:Ig-like domain-containing protein [Mycolicibacterium arseniciresistens]MDO3636126.1 Ig-like domain-containing protein [Mycolicibacterium arseniciresistens]
MGRVGALAIALGVGVAVAAGGSGVAWAEHGDGAGGGDTSNSDTSGGNDTDTTNSDDNDGSGPAGADSSKTAATDGDESQTTTPKRVLGPAWHRTGVRLPRFTLRTNDFTGPATERKKAIAATPDDAAATGAPAPATATASVPSITDVVTQWTDRLTQAFNGVKPATGAWQPSPPAAANPTVAPQAKPSATGPIVAQQTLFGALNPRSTADQVRGLVESATATVGTDAGRVATALSGAADTLRSQGVDAVTALRTQTTTAVQDTPATTALAPVAQGPVARIVSGLLAAIGITPGSAATNPVQPLAPQTLLGVLALIRREIEHTFFNKAPQFPTETIGLVTEQGEPEVITGLPATDADGDPITYTAPARGAVGGPTNGTVVISKNAAGVSTVTYTPDPGYQGTDRFTLTASDAGTGFHLHGLASLFNPRGAHTDSVLVSVDITDTNDAPVVDDQPFTVDSIDPAYGVVKGSVNVDDADGDDLTYALVTVPDPKYGVVVLDEDTGKWTFVPTPETRVRAFATDGVDVVSFTVTATDGESTTAPITVRAPVSAAEVAAFPSVEGLAVGAVRFGPDGTRYQTVLVPNLDSNTFEYAVAVIRPNSPTPTVTTPQPGIPFGAMVFGPDGTIYQPVATLDPQTSAITGMSVTVIRPDLTTATIPITGTPAGEIGFDSDGNVYQSSYVRDTATDTYVTTVTVIDPVTGTKREFIQEGYGGVQVGPDGTVWVHTETVPFNTFNDRVDTHYWSVLDPITGLTPKGTVLGDDTATNDAPDSTVYGPGGKVYQTTRLGFDDPRYFITVIDPDTGASDSIELFEKPAGRVVFGPDGTAYQSVSSGLYTTTNNAVVVISPDGDAETIPIEGIPSSVRFMPDGTAYLGISKENSPREVVIIGPAGDLTPYLTADGVPVNGVNTAPDGTVYLTAIRTANPGEEPGTHTDFVFDPWSDNARTVSVLGDVDAAPTFTADGTAYVRSHSATQQLVSVINPARTNTTVVELPDGVSGSVQIGSSGPAYVLTESGSGNEVTIIRSDGTSTTVALPSRFDRGIDVAPDGTAYSRTDLLPLPGDHALAVIRPDGTLTEIDLPGDPYQAWYAADGTLYQVTSVYAGVGTYDYFLTIVEPGGMTHTTRTLAGEPQPNFGPVSEGPGGAYYKLNLTTPTGPKTLVILPDFSTFEFNGDSLDTRVMPDGTVYQTTRVALGGDDYDYSLARIDAGGVVTTVPIEGTPYGAIVVGPDGTVYQTIEVDDGGNTDVLVFTADGHHTVRLEGSPQSAVTFGPDGTGYVTTNVIDLDALTFESVVWVVAAASDGASVV